MKKYQQLLIVSLGLVSFICFLIYKHEYDRLRNVLEVLEVFGSPPSPDGNQNIGPLALRSHPLEINHNPALGAGSINELNLGGSGAAINNNNAHNLAYDAKLDPGNQPAFDDTFVLKNGHGVRPPDNEEAGGGEDLKGRKGNGMQNQVQGGSGEVVDNVIDDGGGGDIGKFGALKTNKKIVQRQPQDSIFKEKQQQLKDLQEGNNDV